MADLGQIQPFLIVGQCLNCIGGNGLQRCFQQQFQMDLDFVVTVTQCFPALNILLDATDIFQYCLCFKRVVPETGPGGNLLLFGDLDLLGVQVKDTSTVPGIYFRGTGNFP